MSKYLFFVKKAADYVQKTPELKTAGQSTFGIVAGITPWVFLDQYLKKPSSTMEPFANPHEVPSTIFKK